MIMGEEGHRPAYRVPASDAADTGIAPPRVLLDVVRRLRARERGYLASQLHDGPIQDLAAMALELAEVRRALRQSHSGEADAIERCVEAIGRKLGRLQDELWPFPRPGSGLVPALQRRTAWLLSTPLAVAVGEGATELPEADIEAVADLVELILAALGNTGPRDLTVAAVRASPDLIVLELTMLAQPGCDPDCADSAAAIATLRRLAVALHARADVPPDGRRLRVCVEMPRCPAL
jgi:hypothetical protein